MKVSQRRELKVVNLFCTSLRVMKLLDVKTQTNFVNTRVEREDPGQVRLDQIDK